MFKGLVAFAISPFLFISSLFCCFIIPFLSSKLLSFSKIMRKIFG